jgi:hypothetical protein
MGASQVSVPIARGSCAQLDDTEGVAYSSDIRMTTKSRKYFMFSYKLIPSPAGRHPHARQASEAGKVRLVGAGRHRRYAALVTNLPQLVASY